MLKSSIWGVVCALGLAGVSVTACSAKGVDSCDPNDPSCTNSAPATKAPSGGGTTGGGDTDNSGGATSAPTTSTPSNPPPGSTGGTTKNDAGGGTAADALCGSKTSADDCYQCCFDAHPAGDEVQGKAYDECVCGTPGTCKTQCAKSYCSDNGPDPTPGDACDTCLNQADDGACGQKAQTACDGNADCRAIDTCITNAKCDAKQ